MKYLFRVTSYAHMGRKSGYDLLFSHLEETMQDNETQRIYFPLFPLYFRVLNFAYSKLTHKLLKRPVVYNFLTECYVLLYSLFNRSDLIIFSNVEHQMFFSGNFMSGIKRPLVGVAHEPYEYWNRLNRRPSDVKDLNALIVLSEAEKIKFQNVLPQEKIHFVPHGVDTDYFYPAPVSSTVNSILCVGGQLRDFETLLKSVRHILTIKPDTQVNIVVSNYYFKNNPSLQALKQYEQVKFHIKISDDALRTLYWNAKVVLLPLLHATANNTLLEAMACGVPIVTNRVGGTVDYVGPLFADLLPLGDAVGMADACISLLNNPVEQATRGSLGRAHVVKHFGLPVVARQLNTVLESVLTMASD